MPNYKVYFDIVQPLHNFFDGCTFYLEGTINETKKQEKDKNSESKFRDINEAFIEGDSQKYIDALRNTIPPLIDSGLNFIGRPNKHKGVICSWFRQLQSEGKINQSINRKQFAAILNEAFSGLNLGTDGKTFDNYSKEFDSNFKQQLLELTYLR